jgi:hypothetical protein
VFLKMEVQGSRWIEAVKFSNVFSGEWVFCQGR